MVLARRDHLDYIKWFMRTETVRFLGALGFELAGYLDLPDEGEPRAYAVLAHCFTCSKNFGSLANIDRALTERGIGVLRFDFTGIGESGGDFAETNFTTNCEEIVRAAEFLGENFGPAALLIGHSFGGIACVAAAAKVDSCRAVVAIGSPDKPRHVLDHFPGVADEIAQNGQATIVVAEREFMIRQQFVDDVQQYDDIVATLTRPLLVMHSPSDDTVPYRVGLRFFDRAPSAKSFICLDGIDHLMKKHRHAKYIGRLIAAWADPYISPRRHGTQMTRIKRI